MTQTPQRQIAFGPFVVDTPNARVLRDGAPVAMTPKAFDVLHYLASRPDRLVAKDELLAAIWPDVVVSEASIKVCIREIRRALGDDAARPTIIQTIHRRGYRFIGCGAVTRADTGATTSATDSQTSGALPSTDDRPFVGRDAEIERLNRAASNASGGERQVIFLAGDAGSGKTCIVEAFLSAVRTWQTGDDAEPALLVGHCFEQYGTSEPYLPLWEALAPLAQGALPAAARIRDLLGRHEAAYTGDAAQPVGGLPRGMSERLRRDLVDALEELSRQLPLVVIVLEDLHWADYSTIDLISAFARRRGQARLMILGTYRPGDARTDGHPLGGVIATLLPARLAGEMVVGHLDETAVSRFLDARFPGERDFPAALARRLFLRTGGHPLFLANLVDDLVEKGLIRRNADRWGLGGDQSASSLDGLPPELDQQVPRSVQAMVEGQLARLEADERQALEAAAVAGVEFSAAAIAAARATDGPTAATFDAIVAAEDACEALAQRHRFLVPVGETEWPDGSIATRYRFTHELYHNVVYGLIPAARKARMHLTLGLRMEDIWRDRVGEVSAELAVHFERGRDWLRAVVHLRASADAAIKHYAHREAVTYLRRALAALDRLPPDQRSPHELPILMSLGVNLQVTRGFGSPKVQEIHARAYSLCRDVVAGGGSPVDQIATFRVLWGIWVFHKVRSDLGKAAEMATQLMTLARHSGDAVQLLQAHQAMCVTHLCLGDFATAVRHTEESVALYQDGDHTANTRLFGQDPGVAAAAFGSVAYALLGRAGDAERVGDRSLELAARLGQPSTLAVAFHFAAMHRQIVGDVGGTEHFAREGLALAFEERFSFWHAGARVLIGWSLARQGRAEGIDDIRKGIAAWLATGSRTYHSYFLGLLSDALSATGDVVAARAAAIEGLAAADELNEGIYLKQLQEMANSA